MANKRHIAPLVATSLALSSFKIPPPSLKYFLHIVIPKFNMKITAFVTTTIILSVTSGLGFDPQTQRIDVSGDHKFVAPGQGDNRGPW